MLFDNVVNKIRSLTELFVIDIDCEIEISFDKFSSALIDYNEVIVGLYDFSGTGLNEFRSAYCKSKKELDFTKFDIDVETFTFLHEIGHLMTKKQFENDYHNYLRESFLINEQFISGEITKEESMIKYAELEPEYLADLWANTYIQTNVEKVKKFDKKYIELRKELFESE